MSLMFTLASERMLSLYVPSAVGQPLDMGMNLRNDLGGTLTVCSIPAMFTASARESVVINAALCKSMLLLNEPTAGLPFCLKAMPC